MESSFFFLAYDGGGVLSPHGTVICNFLSRLLSASCSILFYYYLRRMAFPEREGSLSPYFSLGFMLGRFFLLEKIVFP